MSFDAIVVLGCRVPPAGALAGAAARRVNRAAEAAEYWTTARVVTSGGKRWAGVAEADAFAEALMHLGVAEARIVRELTSLTTVENVRYVLDIARAEGWSKLAVVTCDWHMPRALIAFGRHGFDVEPLPARAPPLGIGSRLSRRFVETARTALDDIVVAIEGRR